jgi:iron(III) transport system substrate-binding protein
MVRKEIAVIKKTAADHARRHLTKWALPAVGIALVATATTACGSSSDATASLPSTMSSLVKQAKAEGQVNWSSPKALDQMQPVIDLFEKKYPGIKVKYSTTLGPDQVNQIKAEQAARKVTIDVANAGGLTVVPSSSLAASINWSQYGVDAPDVFDKNFVYIWAGPKVWVYNTKELSQSEVPTSWEALLDPRWGHGKVAADSAGAFMTVWASAPGMGAEKADAWAKQFAKQQPHFATGVNQTHTLVESGQTEIGASLMNLLMTAQQKGAPLALAPISPATTNEGYMYVPQGAPHPAAAVLLTSFLSSAEGQAALAEKYNSRIPLTTDCSDQSNAVVHELCAAGVKWYPVGSTENYQHLPTFFSDVTKSLGTDVN